MTHANRAPLVDGGDNGYQRYDNPRLAGPTQDVILDRIEAHQAMVALRTQQVIGEAAITQA